MYMTVQLFWTIGIFKHVKASSIEVTGLAMIIVDISCS